MLTGIGKMARPKLKQRYGDRLEQLYADLVEGHANDLLELRRDGADRPVLETISRAAAALLGAAGSDMRPDAHFSDLGGDSLSALTFANLLHEIFDIDVSVGVIVSPATDLQGIADYIDTQRQPGVNRPTFASVHGRDATQVHAGDLKVDKFIDATTLAAAPTLPRSGAQVRTVLLTGATGFLGRFLALEWLERLAPVGGKLVCLVRAKDDAAAQDAAGQDVRQWRSGAAGARYRELAADHLEVVVGDKGEAEPRAGSADLAAAGRHRRPDRRPRGPGQPRPALQPAVRPQRRRHRRAHPPRAHHQTSSPTPTCRPSGVADASRSRPSAGGRRHPAWSARPATSMTVTPTATTTASGPPRCCCAKPTTSAGCRWRCSAAT